VTALRQVDVTVVPESAAILNDTPRPVARHWINDLADKESSASLPPEIRATVGEFHKHVDIFQDKLRQVRTNGRRICPPATVT